MEPYLGMIVYSSIAEAGGLLRIQGQPGLYNEYHTSQGYTVRSYLTKKN